MKSVWSKTVEIPERKALSGNLRTDVAVIGAGITGILTAYYLKQEGFNVAVLEADRIASGQTKNTTAKITSQHGMFYDTLIKKHGVENARIYARANEAAISAYERIIDENHIEAHFKRLPSYLYSIKDGEALKREAKAASSLGINAHFTMETELPFAIAGAVCFENQAQFHPLEFIKQISEKVTIYEKTRVLSVKKHVVYTDKGEVTAKYIVFATHYPFINLPGFYFMRQHQERSYVLALSGVEKFNGMYYGIDKNSFSFRMIDDILLFGGGAHRTGENKAGGVYAHLREEAEKYYPKYNEIAYWSAQDCISHDYIPFIGRFSILRPYWYVATGFKKWGMTTSMLSAMIISDQICGRENSYEKLFTPQRLYFIASAGDLAKDIGKSVKGLAKGHFHIPFVEMNELPIGKGCIVRRGFRRYGCYRDENGILHRISVRCPHMGCELEWNPDELSWDCPCHGSRYNYDGKLIDNPAQVEKCEKKY